MKSCRFWAPGAWARCIGPATPGSIAASRSTSWLRHWPATPSSANGRFLSITDPLLVQGGVGSMPVVLNWFEELKAKVPAGK
jgi:hypothetical protein